MNSANSRGRYIVIEGPEGVGKTTQLNMLADRLQAAGYPVRTLREPDSQSDLTARAIRQLTQDPRYPMNTRTEVLLYNAARSQSLEVIRASVEQGIICLVDRNYLTTLAIQYYGRGDVPDYQAITNIIKFAVGENEPDLCIVMDAPATTLKERVRDRYNGERFDNLDEGFLERVRAGYLWEAKQRQFPVVFANTTPEEVGEQIWQLVSTELTSRDGQHPSEPTAIKEIIEQKAAPYAPPISPELPVTAVAETEVAATSQEVQPADEQPLVEKTKYGMRPTAAGKAWLREHITNVDGDVYATTKLEGLTAAAAMARLSRRGDDMRVTILDEFAANLGKDEKLIQRVITAYGDDSVQQLVGQHLVVENASNLLTKKLEWGRLAAYLEQSTRYIYFDQKDAQGHYRFHIPKHFKPSIRKQYIEAMNTMFDLYSAMVHALTLHLQNASDTPEAERDGAWKGAIRAQACDAVRPVLPVATTSTVGIFASGQALESLIMHLLSDDLPEARITGQRVLDEARKVMPTFLERADNPERGGALIAYRSNTHTAVQKLATDLLPDNYAATSEAVTLTDYWPRNELNLVPDMLYEHSNLPLEAIETEVASWSYDKKTEVFAAYMGERLNRRHRPGRALEKAHYSWDLVCDYGIFRDLQRHRMVDDLEWQQLTPRYGYETPKLIEEANLTDQFEACFEISLKLYSLLQQSGYALEAQYATLLGHKMRWKVTYNAREAFHLHELRTSPQGHPGYRKLVLQMHEKLAEVHPQLAEAMRFVNSGEDAKLTRLAAERYTQYKLQQLDK
ncbi:MAG: putative thymidylate synthase [Candidatus Saccharibacteria bacterium]|nr:putative thymidylate synthase [Candidatus Saccharibacteria bacterium]